MATSWSTAVPDFVERKGSMFLRSNHMNYARATLTSNWYVDSREAEPKNYDINRDPTRDLCKATYDRIGDITDGSLPKTTYQEHSEEIFLKKREFEEKKTTKPMITVENVSNLKIDRDIGSPNKGYGSVLPRHDPDHNKYYLESTHRADFTPPYPYQPSQVPDLSIAFKKCHSQFTDTSDYRRNGRNTWQDESGIYNNTHYKRQIYKVADPIPVQLQ
ncbi:hypothetical protein LOTGIDRAFT_144812 [Lottia gigantea]|uniref:Uncharacterized protein n=1 Tax=Lottia gigantea TaxID=225164 RepID=V4ADI6_LOTGI|nr:hypothetical protein LOTGIDRAFT_144812 [Lottia gigantea]ESO94907.1 hypothetical protein LOTGIDRAFT_144812 [Lottia gigantea]